MGIIGLQEIVIRSPDVETHKKAFAKLPGIISSNANLFQFNSGPSIRLISSADAGIEKIVIQVKSLSATKEHLSLNNLLDSEKESRICIQADKINGLQIEFAE